MKRFTDWPARLAAYLEQHRATPFAWGENDCAVFAAGAVKAITGVDLLPADRWQSVREASRAIVRLGGLRAALDARLPAVPVAYAQRGDVLLVTGPRVQLAIADADGWLAPSRAGLVRGRMDCAIAAWGVGRG